MGPHNPDPFRQRLALLRPEQSRRPTGLDRPNWRTGHRLHGDKPRETVGLALALQGLKSSVGTEQECPLTHRHHDGARHLAQLLIELKGQRRHACQSVR